MDETEKPKIRWKFAKPPARYNEFGYKLIQNYYQMAYQERNYALQSKDRHYVYKNTKLEFCKEN